MSGSVTVKVPLAINSPESDKFKSSVTFPVFVPVITAASFIPVIVTDTTCVVPSSETAVKLSITVSPIPSS